MLISLSSGPIRHSGDPIPAGSRLACHIEYCGTGFSGWQSQPHLPVATVQETLEAALSQVANTAVRVVCAGRTDTGVHATGQVVSFSAPVTRSEKSWVQGANGNMPPSVRVKAVTVVDPQFHARFSATARRYQYIIANTAVRPALSVGQVSWYRAPLDAERMHQAAQSLLGKQDFSAFRAARCQSPTPVRHVDFVSVYRVGELVVIEVQANAFLHHMVRNIVGSLIAVGCGRKPVEWLAELLAGGDRTVAADTAAADGLYLIGVAYPRSFALPWCEISAVVENPVKI